MADIIFTDATVLSYDVENYFLGDGVARYGSTKRLSIEVMSYNINLGGSTTAGLNPDFNNDGISETWDNLTTYLNNANNFENIKIKVGGTDWDLGKGIIDSISTTEQNPIRVGYHRFSIEIPYASIDNLPSTGSYEGIQDAFKSDTIGNNAELIRDFSESFNFSEDEDGTYTHEHSVSIRFEEGKNNVDEIAKGKAFAAKLFEADEAPPFGFAVRPGLFDDTGIKDKRHYYTETYDAFTKTCSFVKRLTIEDEDVGDYTKKITHTTNLEANGIISVTENCEIKGKDNYAQALAGMDSELHPTNGSSANNNTGTARTRCIAVFTSNENFLGKGGKYNGGGSSTENADTSNTDPDPLKTGTTGLSRLNQAIAISKQYNKKKKTVNYTITFNNDPTITNDYIHEFSQNYTENQNGALTVTQNGRIRPYGQKETNALASIKAFFKQVQDGTNGQISFRSRAEQYYDDLADEATGATVETHLKPTATSVTFGGGKAGMEISYSKSFSDDLPLRYSYGVSSAGSSTASQVTMPATLKRLNISIADTVPQLIRSTYAIPNKSDGYQLLHEPDDSLGKQTNMGVRTVEIKAQKARVSSQNVYSNFPSLSSDLTYLRQLALIKAAEVVPDLKLPSTDLFLESCSYSFNNNREITFRISTKYATKSNLAYNNIHPTAINT
jgi:hypothetical protein